APGLNLEWTIAPKSFPQEQAQSFFFLGTQPMKPLQTAVADFIDSRRLDETIEHCRKHYAKRAQTFITGLKTTLPDGIHPIEPHGGFTMFARCSHRIPPADLFKSSLKAS